MSPRTGQDRETEWSGQFNDWKISPVEARGVSQQDECQAVQDTEEHGVTDSSSPDLVLGESESERDGQQHLMALPVRLQVKPSLTATSGRRAHSSAQPVIASRAAAA